jgi:hypothetical protein
MKLVAQEKPVATTHEVLGDIKFPVEVPEFETLEEFATAAGGPEKALAFVNGQVSTNAKNAARAYARSYDVAEGTPEDSYQSIRDSIALKGQQLAREYTPSSDSRAPGQAKKAQAFDKLAELVNSGQPISAEQLAALITLGK